MSSGPTRCVTPVIARPANVFLPADEFGGFVLMFEATRATIWVKALPELENSSLITVQALFKTATSESLDDAIGLLLQSNLPITSVGTGLFCASGLWRVSSSDNVDTVLPVLRLKGRLVILHSVDNASLACLPDIDPIVEEAVTCI